MKEEEGMGRGHPPRLKSNTASQVCPLLANSFFPSFLEFEIQKGVQCLVFDKQPRSYRVLFQEE